IAWPGSEAGHPGYSASPGGAPPAFEAESVHSPDRPFLVDLLPSPRLRGLRASLSLHAHAVKLAGRCSDSAERTLQERRPQAAGGLPYWTVTRTQRASMERLGERPASSRPELGTLSARAV